MKNRDLVLCGVFMLAMFMFLMVGTVLMSGTMYGFMAGKGFAAMFVSMYFWCRFSLPLLENRK